MTTEAPALLSDAPLGEVSVVGDAMQVVFRRRYAKPIEKVWAAIASPARIADWLAAAEYEPKIGGVIRLNWNNGANTMTGRVTAYDPPHSFGWTWEIGGRETNVLFELQADDGGCWLTLTHSGLSPKAGPGAGVRAGWHAHMEGIAEAIEGRATPWATKVARQEALADRYPALPA